MICNSSLHLFNRRCNIAYSVPEISLCRSFGISRFSDYSNNCCGSLASFMYTRIMQAAKMISCTEGQNRTAIRRVWDACTNRCTTSAEKVAQTRLELVVSFFHKMRVYRCIPNQTLSSNGKKKRLEVIFFTTAPFVAEVGFEPTGSFWERLAYETSKLGHYLTPRYKTSFLLSNIRVFFFPRNVYGCCIKRTTVKSYSTAFHVGPAGIEPTSSDFQSAALTTSATTPKNILKSCK